MAEVGDRAIISRSCLSLFPRAATLAQSCLREHVRRRARRRQLPSPALSSNHAFTFCLLPVACYLLPLSPAPTLALQFAACTAAGLLLLLVVAVDVYATILDARPRGGPISELLNRSLWFAVRTLALRLPRQRRHRLLNLIGPLLLPALIASYLCLLIGGFALIYYPHMPE
ncbi:MAG: hypothetical protein ACRD9R_14620, partial [Pyrinomonadaceae bacterium]